MIALFSVLLLSASLALSEDYVSEWSPCPLLEFGDPFGGFEEQSRLWRPWSPFLRFRHAECQNSEECPEQEETCNLHLKSVWPQFNESIHETNANIIVLTPPQYSDQDLSWTVSRGSRLSVRWNWKGDVDTVSVLLMASDSQSGTWPIPLDLRISNHGIWNWTVPSSASDGTYRILVHSTAQISSISGAFRISSGTPASFPDHTSGSVCHSQTTSAYEISIQVPPQNIHDKHFSHLLTEELASILEIDSACVSLIPEVFGDFILAKTKVSSDHCQSLNELWKTHSKAHGLFQEGLILQRVSDVSLIQDGCKKSASSLWIWAVSLGVAPLALGLFYGRRKMQSLPTDASERKMEEKEDEAEGVLMGILQDGKGKFFPYLVPLESVWETDSPQIQNPSPRGRIIEKSWSIRKLDEERETPVGSEYSSGKYLGNSVDISDDEVLRSTHEDSSISSESVSPFWDLP